MKQHEIEALLKDCAKKIREGNLPGKYITLAYAVISTHKSGGLHRLIVPSFSRNLLHNADWLDGLSVAAVLVQRISANRLSQNATYLSFFEGIEIPKEKLEEAKREIASALQRLAKLKKDESNRVRLDDAVTAILGGVTISASDITVGGFFYTKNT